MTLADYVYHMCLSRLIYFLPKSFNLFDFPIFDHERSKGYYTNALRYISSFFIYIFINHHIEGPSSIGKPRESPLRTESAEVATSGTVLTMIEW